MDEHLKKKKKKSFAPFVFCPWIIIALEMCPQLVAFSLSPLSADHSRTTIYACNQNPKGNKKNILHTDKQFCIIFSQKLTNPSESFLLELCHASIPLEPEESNIFRYKNLNRLRCWEKLYRRSYKLVANLREASNTVQICHSGSVDPWMSFWVVNHQVVTA